VSTDKITDVMNVKEVSMVKKKVRKPKKKLEGLLLLIVYLRVLSINMTYSVSP
jgi:hypothetical protein